MSLGFAVHDLSVSINTLPLLKEISFKVKPGELHALMGPNGSGKSSLAYTLMGHPKYTIERGTIELNGVALTSLAVDERAKQGLFLAFQYPYEVEGVTLFDFLRQTYNALHGGTEKQLGLKAFRSLVEERMKLLAIKPDFIDRFLNFGFSGGEKKRAEMLQCAVLQPKVVILDEIDSGLDIDALRIVCESIATLRTLHPSMSLIIITHYQRILNYLQPDYVHVLQEGRIVRFGSGSLARELDIHGYDYCAPKETDGSKK